jgi:ethanolamine utilization protein EutQ (cupin superfamily)
MSIGHYPSQPFDTGREATPGRAIITPDPKGWDTIALTEWELRQAEWTDSHPFDETNYVLAGVLHVESDGQIVVAAAGDTVTVTAGSAGRYWAPDHARMLAIYSPNPEGRPSAVIGYRRL